MEVSDKEMRRFVEKLLEEAGQDTLTQRIIRQRFIGYLGVDEDSFGDHNKNRLRQIVLETMMPTTNHQKPPTVPVPVQESGLLKTANKTLTSVNKHQAVASGESDSEYNTSCGNSKKKRLRIDRIDSDTDSVDDNKEDSAKQEDHDVAFEMVAATATVKRSRAQEWKRTQHSDSGSDSESDDLKNVGINLLSSKDEYETRKQTSEDECDVSIKSPSPVPNLKKVPKRRHQQPIGSNEELRSTDSGSDNDEEQTTKQVSKSKHMKADTIMQSAVRSKKTSDSSDTDENKDMGLSNHHSRSSDIMKTGTSDRITERISDSSSGSESNDREKPINKQDTKQLINKSKVLTTTYLYHWKIFGRLLSGVLEERSN
jgi:hypothetical protein